MKRIIYTLTAIFSAITAAVFIIDIIGYIIEIIKIIPDISPEGEYSYSFYFPIFVANLVPGILRIAVILALGILSVVQLKKHTPRIILLLCGYIFFEAALTMSGQYLFGLLLLAAALTPAIYEFSHYGMLVRQEPKAPGQSRWRWLHIATIAVVIFRVLPFILQLYIDIRIVNNNNISINISDYSTDIMGISALVCFAVFCGLMSRRTSGLYRMFFTGCILFDAIQTVFINYSSFISHTFQNSMASALFIFLEILYALFVLLILIHASLTRRDVPVSPEHTDIALQAETPAALKTGEE